jgi:hypothetical protein
MLVTDTYSVAYPSLSASGVIPIKLKRKTHPCCGAFDGSTQKKEGISLSVLQVVKMQRKNRKLTVKAQTRGTTEKNSARFGNGVRGSYVFPAEVVEHDGERAEGEKHVDLGLEDDDAHAGERPPPPAPGRERLGHRGERADVLEVQRVHLPGRRRRRARR